MDPWVQRAAAVIAGRAGRELEALVGVSSPSGDVHGAEECAAVCVALLPQEATVERGVIGVPTLLLAGEPVWGDDRLDEALAAAGLSLAR